MDKFFGGGDGPKKPEDPKNSQNKENEQASLNTKDEKTIEEAKKIDDVRKEQDVNISKSILNFEDDEDFEETVDKALENARLMGDWGQIKADDDLFLDDLDQNLADVFVDESREFDLEEGPKHSWTRKEKEKDNINSMESEVDVESEENADIDDFVHSLNFDDIKAEEGFKQYPSDLVENLKKGLNRSKDEVEEGDDFGEILEDDEETEDLDYNYPQNKFFKFKERLQKANEDPFNTRMLYEVSKNGEKERTLELISSVDKVLKQITLAEDSQELMHKLDNYKLELTKIFKNTNDLDLAIEIINTLGNIKIVESNYNLNFDPKIDEYLYKVCDSFIDHLRFVYEALKKIGLKKDYYLDKYFEKQDWALTKMYLLFMDSAKIDPKYKKLLNKAEKLSADIERLNNQIID